MQVGAICQLHTGTVSVTDYLNVHTVVPRKKTRRIGDK